SRRRHTRLVSDWSSDVCSSDLTMTPLPSPIPESHREELDRTRACGQVPHGGFPGWGSGVESSFPSTKRASQPELDALAQRRRQLDRKSVVEGKSERERGAQRVQ